MSIFGKIASAIFGPSASSTPASGVPQDAIQGIMMTDTSAAAPAAAPITTAAAQVAPAAAPAASAAAAAPQMTVKPGSVDVAMVLDNITDESDEDDLDWRKSIVDLMKLLKMDSSLKSRKELATELKYSGDMGDSAAMNVWLHKQVMTKLAENGGVVPKELKHS
jgi:3-oxoacyl-ACP reductase-like protein